MNDWDIRQRVSVTIARCRSYSHNCSELPAGILILCMFKITFYYGKGVRDIFDFNFLRKRIRLWNIVTSKRQESDLLIQ